MLIGALGVLNNQLHLLAVPRAHMCMLMYRKTYCFCFWGIAVGHQYFPL